jgi:polyhydroxyalkanoate synthesis regulator phasin
MKYPIKDEIDYLIAQSQIETDVAKEIVADFRKKGQTNDQAYYEEKLALKMLEFFKEEEKIIALYAEAKKNYPLLSELMENKRPYLKEMLAEAKKLYEKNILGK